MEELKISPSKKWKNNNKTHIREYNKKYYETTSDARKKKYDENNELYMCTCGKTLKGNSKYDHELTTFHQLFVLKSKLN
jgi:hypothetical protein